MDDKTHVEVDEELELPEDIDAEEAEVEVEEDADTEDAEETTEAIEEEAEPELSVSLGDEEEEAEEPAPDWVRELRKSHREQAKENRRLKKELEQLQKPQQPQQVTLGEKPTLESADYDAQRYEQELAAWFERKREFEAQQQAQQAEAERQQQEYKRTYDAYLAKREALNLRDYEDAEDTVKEELSSVQQSLILHTAEDPALLVYALGKNPKKARELASITDNAKFVAAAVRLEAGLKVTSRKAATKPEKTVSSSSKGVTSGSDGTLERLRSEAEKTGDYSKVFAYKRKLKRA